jgi:hypothetical protein
MKVSFTHEIEAPIEKVYEAYRSADFYRAKQKSSGATEVKILEHERVDEARTRLKAEVTEPSRVPRFLRKSEVDTYVDESLLDTESGTLSWKVTPDKMADVFFLSGKIEFAGAGDRTRITYRTELEVKIPLVGKKAEKIGLEKTEEETERQARFLQSWVDGRAS